MPPKKQRATSSSKAKKPSKVATKSTVATKTTSTAGPVAATTAQTKSYTKKRAASESPEVEEPIFDKKAKLACHWERFKLLADSPPPEEEFSAEDKALFSKSMLQKFKKLRFTLSDHVPRSMAAIFEGIKYEDAIPDNTSITAQVDGLISELKKRVLSGKRINEELAVIEKVNINHWAGEYDDDPDGLTKDVRMRIDDAKHMVARLTGSSLKSIMRQLNPFSGGGSNADMADEIVGILLHLAKQGKNIKREYMTVKAYYTKCDGKCDNPSDPALDLNYGSDEYEYPSD